MPQPPAYARNKDFTVDAGSATDHTALNAELDALQQVLDAVRANLALMQNDQGGPATPFVQQMQTAIGISTVADAAAAASSASAAATSEANAATSAANAAASEANAATSAGQAASSESQASISANNASAQANNALLSAQQASASASNALNSSNSAAASANNAATSESNAAASASNAATSESNAATSAANAAASEANAATSAANAAASEANAATSAANAAASASQLTIGSRTNSLPGSQTASNLVPGVAEVAALLSNTDQYRSLIGISGADLNTIIATGFYDGDANSPNAPPAYAGSGWFHLLVMRHGNINSTTVKQIAFSHANNSAYVRTGTGGSGAADANWSAWEPLGSGAGSPAANGYQTLGNGMILQWGTIHNMGVATAHTVVFPIAFPTLCASVAISVPWNDVASANSSADSFTTTSFRARSAVTSTADRSMSWIAVGF